MDQQSKRNTPQAFNFKELCEHSSSASRNAFHMMISFSLQIPPTSTLRIQTTDRLPCLFYFLSTSLHSSLQQLQKLRFARIQPINSMHPYVGNVGINVSEATSYTGSVVLLARKKRKENHLLLLAAAAATAAHASPSLQLRSSSKEKRCPGIRPDLGLGTWITYNNLRL